MSSNICGNCQNFKPKKADKFFNCTNARHAGIKYGMQVRADTRSCDAFMPFGTAFKPASSPSQIAPSEPEPKPTPSPQPATAPSPMQKSASTSKPKPEVKLKRQPKPKPTPKLPQELPNEDRPRPTGLCVWGKAIFISVLVLIIGLPAWGIYSCTSSSTSAPIPTPPPMPTNATITDFAVVGGNVWATAPDRQVMVSSTEKESSYTLPTGETFNAPSGKVFIFIAVTCKNTGNASFLTGPAYFLLTDSTGHSYQDQTYSNYRFGKPYPNASLSPGITVSGNILWIVPVSTSGLEVSYLLDSRSNPPLIARWILPQ